MRIWLGALALALALHDAASAWVHRYPAESDPDAGNAILAVEPNSGDAFFVVPARAQEPTVVTRLDAETGRPRWTLKLSYRARFTATRLVTPDGDLLLAGAGDDEHTVMRISGDGQVRWTGGPKGYVTSLALTADGDVVAVGDIGLPAIMGARIDGATGAVEWRYVNFTVPTAGRAGDVAITGDGGIVLVAGRPRGASADYEAVAIALDPTTGAERWRWGIDGTNETPSGIPISWDVAYGVGAVGTGDVVVTGQLENESPDGTPPEFDAFIVRLGTDGSEKWRTLIAGVGVEDVGSGVLPDAAGDVVVVGRFDDSPANEYDGGPGQHSVVKLDGVTGAERWRAAIGDVAVASGGVSGAAVRPDGDVVIAGYLASPTGGGTIAVARLRGSDGARVWLRTLGSPPDGGMRPGRAMSLGLRPDGTASVSGRLATPRSSNDVPVLAFSTSEQIDPSTGRLRRREKAGTTTLVFTARDRLALAPAPGMPGDPTRDGAALDVLDAGGAVRASVPLAAGRWGRSPSGALGRHAWSFRGARGPDACASVEVASGGAIRFRCTFTSAALPGVGEAVGVRLRFGSEEGSFVLPAIVPSSRTAR